MLRIDCTSGRFIERKGTMLFFFTCDVQFTQAWHCLNAVREYFPYDRLLEITPSRIEAYPDHRLKQSMARATVNREVRYLLGEYRLLFDTHEIWLRSQGGENVREGFSTASEFEANKDAVFRDTAYLIMEEERNDWKPKTWGDFCRLMKIGWRRGRDLNPRHPSG